MLAFVVLFGFVAVVVGQNPTVTTEDGVVRGTENKTEGKGNPYQCFRGIPYAAPPIGDLRFRSPQPAIKWTDILDATEDGPPCLISDTSTNKAYGDEDCLTINVYKPLSCSGSLPTMVWIYGGAFIAGDSTYAKYGPDYFLDNCVCFVSFNYRLGILGFLGTEDDVVPGNNGHKDQRFALQWIQRNIEAFGCSKDNVLLFGESAGSASVSVLSQSDSTKGLFHKKIMHSGSSICQWARVRKPRTQAFAVGALLGITATDTTTLVEELRKKSGKDIQSAGNSYVLGTIISDPLNLLIGIGPVIEPSSSPDPIITEKSYQGLVDGHFNQMPTIIGFNSNEGTAVDQLPISLLIRTLSIGYGNFIQNVVPLDMNIKDTVNYTIVKTAITKYYYGAVPILNLANNYPQTIQLVSDSAFVKPIVKNSQLEAKSSTVYLYQFSFEDPWGTPTNRTVKGVGHADELNYFFRRAHDFPISDEAARIRLLVCKLWTNFAYTSNPNTNPDNTDFGINWAQTGSAAVQLYNINVTSGMIQQPHKEALTLWDKLYATYGVSPYDTW